VTEVTDGAGHAAAGGPPAVGDLPRRLAAEALGTAFLLATVVGSGIMGERLAGGNEAVALLANTLATGAGLAVYILVFGPVSGAHFNPAVTLIECLRGRLAARDAAAYAAAQIVGGVAGVAAAHLMFEVPAVFAVSPKDRSGAARMFGEFVATFGLLGTILSVSRSRPGATPFAVGLYIASAYWFTSSTSFANPAVTLARCLTATFAGIRPADAPGFVVSQLLGALAGLAVFGRLLPPSPKARVTVSPVAAEAE
jgi:glycerol uptake facilitator-like aquaporin